VTRLSPFWCVGAGVLLAAPSNAQLLADASDPLTQLSRMSLEELAHVQVTSVSRSTQSLSSAPASIYVITSEEIRRSGVLSIPEALRLAPNLQVEQINAQEYQIGARGFGSHLEFQNFSNKILILIDGRSVYNPLFSGVAYDAQDVVMDDIDRIEVISGPGATLWGANAMNGVINIITRNAHDTEGGLLRASGGDQENALTARYGDSFGRGDDPRDAYRVYLKAFDRGPSELESGASGGDRWHKVQAGFRVDLGAGTDRDRFTIQGDYQDATENVGAFGDIGFTQHNLLGRWEHDGERADTRLQVFIDSTDRGQPPSGVGFTLSTYDVDFQQSLQLGGRHRVVWGFGRRYSDYDIDSTPTLAFDPEHRTLQLTNVFGQDTITLSDQLKLTLGLKFEENSYSGWATLPDVRLAWSPAEHSLVWASAARAIRSPTPLDADVIERADGVNPFLVGDPGFEPETVDAFELGYRSQPHASISWSVSAFYNQYDDLRTIEPAPGGFLPLRWGNLMEGSTYGFEVWGNWQVARWWRLSPGYRSVHKRLEFSDGASQLLGVEQAGNDPTWRGTLKSSMDFGKWSVDAMLRYVAKLPSPESPSYTELGARVAWQATDAMDVSINGLNLLDDRHHEYAVPTAREIRRSIYAEVRWLF